MLCQAEFPETPPEGHTADAQPLCGPCFVPAALAKRFQQDQEIVFVLGRRQMRGYFGIFYRLPRYDLVRQQLVDQILINLPIS